MVGAAISSCDRWEARPSKTKMAMEDPPIEDVRYFVLKMVIVHCYPYVIFGSVFSGIFLVSEHS